MLWLGLARGSSAAAIKGNRAEPSDLDKLGKFPFGNCFHLEKCPWEVSHGKIPLEKYLISAPYKVLNITSGILTLCLVA